MRLFALLKPHDDEVFLFGNFVAFKQRLHRSRLRLISLESLRFKRTHIYVSQACGARPLSGVVWPAGHALLAIKNPKRLTPAMHWGSKRPYSPRFFSPSYPSSETAKKTLVDAALLSVGR